MTTVTSTPSPTIDDLNALGLRTDLVTACRFVYGCGKNKSWELFHRGELDFPAIRVGRRVVVPVQKLKELLGVSSIS